jgi:hypothetical protein
MSDLNQVVRDQLKASDDANSNKKQLLASELQPVQTALVDLGSSKIGDLTDYTLKKISQKGAELFKNKTGIDLLAKKQQLTQKGQQIVESMNNQANNLMNKAETNISNTLSNSRDSVHNALNKFQGLQNIHDELPHLPSLGIEKGAEDVAEDIAERI